MECSQTPTTTAGGEHIAAKDTRMNVFLPENGCDYVIDGSNRHACSSLTVGDEKSPSPAVSAHCSGKSADDMAEEDGFYQKLNKMNESSGLSLLFNFRETRMDLLHFYKIVTDRGGYHQVTKDGKWEEVALCSTQKNKIQLTPIQLQKLYGTILYPFEKMYHYRTPAKLNENPLMIETQLDSWGLSFEELLSMGDSLNGSMGKRKYDERLYAPKYNFHDGESPSKKIEYDFGSQKSFQVGTIEGKKLVLKTPSKVKEVRKDPRAPLGSRNCYQMFLKMEGERLKRIHNDNPSARLRDVFIETWKQLSDEDKQPYIEASKKDKQRYLREMEVYEEQMRKELAAGGSHMKFSSVTPIDFTMPSREQVGGSQMIPGNDSGNQKVADFAKPPDECGGSIDIMPS